MSNQLFSNNIVRYSDQITPFAYTGVFLPSGMPFVANMQFKKNGSICFVEFTVENQQACLITDNAISLNWPTITLPEQFRRTPRSTIFVLMNMGGNYVKDQSKWTFQPDGNIVVTRKNSSYPDVNDIPSQPAFGVTVIGATYGSYIYNL